MRFWLRFGDHDVELQSGETFIGRSPRCQLVVDDPMVSRQHARITVDAGKVSLEDLGSVNGVLVNGARVEGTRTLSSGDRVLVGQQSFELFVAAPSAGPPTRSFGPGAPTLTGSSITDLTVDSEDHSESTRQGDAFDMLAGVVEKVLALGRGEEAERIISSYLRNLLKSATVESTEPDLADRAASYAVRIADATGKGEWIDYVFELYTRLRRPMPAGVVEQLYTSVRRVKGASLAKYRQYAELLRSIERRLGPSERFIVRRIQGLEEVMK